MLPPAIADRPRSFAAETAPLLRATETVWVSQGGGGASNSVLITAPGGRVVVNTGIPGEASLFRQRYDDVDDSPIRYVVVTQGHPDHYGAVDLFVDPGCEVIGHRDLHKCADDWKLLARHKGDRLKIWQLPYGFMLSTASDPITIDPPAPDIEVSDELSVEVGGRDLHVFAGEGAETTDSLMVWLPDEETLIVGNLFGALYGHIPNLQTIRGDRVRDPVRIAESFDKVLSLRPQTLVVGHHGPVEGRAQVLDSVQRIRDAMMYIHDTTLAGLNEGKPVEVLMQEISLPPNLEVLQGYGRVAWCVRAVATLYLGWFEARSTTELYPTTPRSMYAELAELVGVDILVSRGQQLLSAGDPLGALHLAEVAGSSTHAAEAHELFVACHHALLKADKHRNVWLDGWLRYQIAEGGRG